MDVLVWILQVGQAAQWVALTLVVVAAIGLIAAGAWRREPRLVLLGAVVGLLPIRGPMLVNRARADARADRRTAIAALPRVPFPAAYPRQMVVKGQLLSRDVARLMILTDLDEVIVDDGGDRQWFSRPDHSPSCRAAATAIAAAEVPGSRSADRAEWARQRRAAAIARPVYAGCLPSGTTPFPIAKERLLVRLDGKVTHRAQDRGPAPQAIQIDLVGPKRETLVYYDEMPILPMTSSSTRLITSPPRYPCQGFQDTQVIANVLDAAKNRPQSAAVMTRDGQYMPNGGCVLSAPAAG